MRDTNDNLNFTNQSFGQNRGRNKNHNEIQKLNKAQLEEILEYRNYKFQIYLSNKCSGVCIKKSNYKDCLDNCIEKLINSNMLFERYLRNTINTANSEKFSIQS
jgi:hypothetical protein